jgi:hypothetical protein
MSKLTMHETPSALLASALPKASNETVLPDSLGRMLTIKEPDVLDESRLARLMGDSSTNMGYMLGYVTPAAMVVAINGEELPFPRTELQVDAAIQRLGREGLGAVMAHLTKEAAAAQAAALAQQAEEIKK